jgi:hypothetical protein
MHGVDEMNSRRVCRKAPPLSTLAQWLVWSLEAMGEPGRFKKSDEEFGFQPVRFELASAHPGTHARAQGTGPGGSDLGAKHIQVARVVNLTKQ